jgi:TetR/AcrR family tetracycline transcriptional repressor
MAKRDGTAMRDRLNRDTIVTGAVALADREGLDAVTIRRLAQDHGVTAMALYWHFREKDQLLDGIAERLFSDVVLPEPTDRPWDERLREVLEAILAAMRPHPAVANLAFTRILASDAGLVVAERVLGLLREARFTPEEAAELGSYLLSALITLVAAEPGPERELDVEERDAAIRTRKATLGALPPQRFPNVIAAAGALSFCANEDTYFDRGIDLLVRGTVGIQPV